VASLFGAAGASGKGGNFVETMVKKARSGESVRVIDDVFMSPTYTADAARLIRHIVTGDLPSGTYHVTNKGVCSWYEFAAAVFRLMDLRVDLAPIKSASLNQKARRPRYSALASIRLKSAAVRSWEDALEAYLREKGHL
jgi:dTDP-4-dehydrorhamnose reductase